MSTAIEWTNKTWNPLRGCLRISPGCGGARGKGGCYAERQAARPILSGPGLPYEGLVTIGRQGPRWTGATAGPDRLDEPLRWKKGRKVFVCSMSDLFYEGHTDEQIAAVFGVMAACPQHTFQVLTKRAERMAAWFEWAARQTPEPWTHCHMEALSRDGEDEYIHRHSGADRGRPWPLPNVWVGVSVEDQQRAQERLPHLLRVPAAVRWVSAEPILGPVVLGLMGTMPHGISPRYAPVCERIHWVVMGGESGPGARPCDLAWIRALRDECRQAQVACFIKQLGARPGSDCACVDCEDLQGGTEDHWSIRLKDRKGGDINEFPDDLRIREWPEVRPC